MFEIVLGKIGSQFIVWREWCLRKHLFGGANDPPPPPPSHRQSITDCAAIWQRQGSGLPLIQTHFSRTCSDAHWHEHAECYQAGRILQANYHNMLMNSTCHSQHTILMTLGHQNKVRGHLLSELSECHLDYKTGYHDESIFCFNDDNINTIDSNIIVAQHYTK